MMHYEYKVIPAPRRGKKATGVKTPEARFALALETVMNAEGADGWEYLRAETLPSDERSGLTSTVMHFRNVLVFRRAIAEAAPQEVSIGETAGLAAVVDKTAGDIAPIDTPPATGGNTETPDGGPAPAKEADGGTVTPLRS